MYRHAYTHNHIDGIASIVVCAGIMAFVILKSDVEIKDEDIVGSLKELVKKKIAAFAIPTAFLVSITICIHYIHCMYVSLKNLVCVLPVI